MIASPPCEGHHRAQQVDDREPGGRGRGRRRPGISRIRFSPFCESFRDSSMNSWFKMICMFASSNEGPFFISGCSSLRPRIQVRWWSLTQKLAVWWAYAALADLRSLACRSQKTQNVFYVAVVGRSVAIPGPAVVVSQAAPASRRGRDKRTSQKGHKFHTFCHILF